MPDSSPSPAAPASYGSRDAVPAHASSAVNRPQKRRVRLPHAEADLNFAAPLQHQTRQRSRKIQEIPANADVAQLVEHFTRNEGVPGSIPGVGFVYRNARVGAVFGLRDGWVARCGCPLWKRFGSLNGEAPPLRDPRLGVSQHRERVPSPLSRDATARRRPPLHESFASAVLSARRTSLETSPRPMLPRASGSHVAASPRSPSTRLTEAGRPARSRVGGRRPKIGAAK